MADRIKVYIASPYTNGDKQKLTDLQVEAAGGLLKLGFNPFTPLLSHYITIFAKDMDDFPWLEVDIEWLKMCDLVVRLHPKDAKGIDIPSPGADEEEEYSKANGIPLFHFDTIPEMIRYFQTFQMSK